MLKQLIFIAFLFLPFHSSVAAPKALTEEEAKAVCTEYVSNFIQQVLDAYITNVPREAVGATGNNIQMVSYFSTIIDGVYENTPMKANEAANKAFSLCVGIVTTLKI